MKIGIIGESLGNGHPYSWSAIINGFDTNLLLEVPFPAIKEYLSKIDSKKVLSKKIKITKIYCQNTVYAEHVAKFSRIDEICSSLEKFTDKLDAVIIAKDDYQNHYNLISYLVDSKLPILIDKPIATNLNDLKSILQLSSYKGQFFTSSGLYFANEIKQFPKDLNKILRIKAVTNGPWDRYAIHIINPLEKYFASNNLKLNNFKSYQKNKFKDQVMLKLNFNDLIVELVSGSNEVFGVMFIFEYKSGKIDKITFKDTYTAFYEMLNCFTRQVETRKPFFTEEDITNTVKIIELGDTH